MFKEHLWRHTCWKFTCNSILVVWVYIRRVRAHHYYFHNWYDFSCSSRSYKDSRQQSERDVPDLDPFRNSLISIKSLKAKERFSRILCTYVALYNSYLIEVLCIKKRKKEDKHTTVPLLTTDFLRGYISMIEDTLTFYL